MTVGVDSSIKQTSVTNEKFTLCLLNGFNNNKMFMQKTLLQTPKQLYKCLYHQREYFLLPPLPPQVSGSFKFLTLKVGEGPYGP